MTQALSCCALRFPAKAGAGRPASSAELLVESPARQCLVQEAEYMHAQSVREAACLEPCHTELG